MATNSTLPIIGSGTEPKAVSGRVVPVNSNSFYSSQRNHSKTTSREQSGITTGSVLFVEDLSTNRLSGKGSSARKGGSGSAPTSTSLRNKATPSPTSADIQHRVSFQTDAEMTLDGVNHNNRVGTFDVFSHEGSGSATPLQRHSNDDEDDPHNVDAPEDDYDNDGDSHYTSHHRMSDLESIGDLSSVT